MLLRLDTVWGAYGTCVVRKIDPADTIKDIMVDQNVDIQEPCQEHESKNTFHEEEENGDID